MNVIKCSFDSLIIKFIWFFFFKIYSARLNTHSRTERPTRNSAHFVSTVRRTYICPWPRTDNSLSNGPTQSPTPSFRTTGASSCTRSPTAACLYSRTTTKVGASYLCQQVNGPNIPFTYLKHLSLYIYVSYRNPIIWSKVIAFFSSYFKRFLSTSSRQGPFGPEVGN